MILTDSKKSKNAYSAMIFDYRSGKVKPVMFFTGIRGKAGVYKSSAGMFAAWYSGSDYSQLIIYKYSSGKMVPYGNLYYLSGKYFKSGKPKLTYGTKSGSFKSKKISEKKYKKIQKKYKSFNLSKR